MASILHALEEGMAHTGSGRRPEENMRQAIEELAARTAEYGAVVEADGDRGDAGSSPRVLLGELRSLLATKSMRIKLK